MNNNANQSGALSEHLHHHTDQVLNQLQSTIENLQMIQKMISEQRPGLDVLKHLSEIFVRLEECRMTVVHDHISPCFRPHLKEGQEKLLQLQEVEQILKLALPSTGANTGSFH